MNDKSVKEIVCNFGNLYKAMRRSKQNVEWKDSVAGFVKNGLVNCYKLKQQQENGTYEIDKYTIFDVYEPKKRRIVSTRIKDRVFQRSLCDNYVYKTVTKGFIYDNVACLQNKGTDFGLKRFKCHLQRFFRKNGLNGYILKCDLSDYFGSTPHETASDAIRKRISDEWSANEIDRIINSFNQGNNPNVGMGLGSQVTQIVELAVLDELDHYIKEKLKIKHYIRYMDDFILIHKDKEYLCYCKSQIYKRLTAIGLKLSERKTHIQPVKQNIHFLGFSFRLTETGKIVMKILPEKISKERRKLKKLVGRVKAGIMTKAEVYQQYSAWKAHASGRRKKKKGETNIKRYAARRNTYHLILKMDQFYKNLWEENHNEIQNSKRTVD